MLKICTNHTILKIYYAVTRQFMIGEKLVQHLMANLQLDFKIDEIASPKRKLVLKIPSTSTPHSQELLQKFKETRLEAEQKTK